jgi:hypothetical protein
MVLHRLASKMVCMHESASTSNIQESNGRGSKINKGEGWTHACLKEIILVNIIIDVT